MTVYQEENFLRLPSQPGRAILALVSMSIAIYFLRVNTIRELVRPEILNCWSEIKTTGSNEFWGPITTYLIQLLTELSGVVPNSGENNIGTAMAADAVTRKPTSVRLRQNRFTDVHSQ